MSMRHACDPGMHTACSIHAHTKCSMSLEVKVCQGDALRMNICKMCKSPTVHYTEYSL